MKNPVKEFWTIRIEELKVSLEKNGFEVHLAQNGKDAANFVLNELIPSLNPSSISFGGSMTVSDSGLYSVLKEREGLEVLDTWDKKSSPKEKDELRRRALLVDLFITGTNAVTEDGMLVNLDMIGNRAGAITYGPRHVLLLIGRNKIVPDIDQAMLRIKEYAAPVNAMRLDKKTPCAKTGRCADCSSPDRICNVWTITEKSFPAGRIKIVLINADLGF